MSGVADLKARLERHGLYAKKGLGQNFLIDDDALAAIAQAALRGQPPALIEIGPGPGTLTAHLAAAGLPLICIEKDQGMLPLLRERFADSPHVELRYGDALDTNFTALHPMPLPAVVGNIPYNISSPILLTLLRQRHGLGRVTLMVQKEVADRLLAEPSTKAYGSLSVLFQAVADLSRIRQVPAGSFLPAPKVDSTVIQLRWKADPLVTDPQLPHFERTVRAAFSLRRKMLRNALRTVFSQEAIEAAAANTGLAMTRRAETLTGSELALLAAALPAVGPDPSPSDPL